MIEANNPKLGGLPVRGASTAEILTNDHNVIKTLLDALTRAEQAHRGSALERLKSALIVHNATEENLVYPALAVIARELSQSAQLFHETAEADTLIFAIDQILSGADGDFDANAHKLQAAILEHIQHEESSAFVHLDKKLSDHQSKSLTTSVIAFRRALEYKA